MEENTIYIEGNFTIKGDLGGLKNMRQPMKKCIIKIRIPTTIYIDSFTSLEEEREEVMICCVEGCGAIDESRTACCVHHARSPHKMIEVQK